jgi:hypothetical protein
MSIWTISISIWTITISIWTIYKLTRLLYSTLSVHVAHQEPYNT